MFDRPIWSFPGDHAFLFGRSDLAKRPEIATGVHFTLKWELTRVSSNAAASVWSCEAGLSQQLSFRMEKKKNMNCKILAGPAAPV